MFCIAERVDSGGGDGSFQAHSGWWSGYTEGKVVGGNCLLVISDLEALNLNFFRNLK